VKGFIALRDVIVQAYRSVLQGVAGRAEGKKPGKKSTGADRTAGGCCDIPGLIIWLITHPRFLINGGRNAECSNYPAFNQILDGAASMAGIPPHARNTPTFALTFDRARHVNSGKSVCADLLCTSTPSFLSV